MESSPAGVLHDEPHWPGTSSLVVPVPGFEAYARARSAFYDEEYVSTDPSFAHAHVTLLSPFVDAEGLTAEVRNEIDQLLSRQEPFAVRFERFGVFPDGTVHLVPTPAEPFSRLTADLAERFPGFRPYGGRFADVRPHLTLDRIGPQSLDDVKAAVADLLPAVTQVVEARLSWYEQGACRTLGTWRLGHSAGGSSPAGPVPRPPRRAAGLASSGTPNASHRPRGYSRRAIPNA